MPAPSAEFILSMLNPYKGFSTADSAKAGIAAGQVASEGRDRRNALAQQKELALADDARAGQYLDLQKQQAAFGQKQDLNDRRLKAYAGFQAAVNAGDTEGADLAANQLRMLGVDVQQYGAGEGSSAAPPSPLGPMAQQSPTAAMAQAQAKPSMSARDAQTSRELDELARTATVKPELGETTPDEDKALAAEAVRLYGDEKQPQSEQRQAPPEPPGLRPAPARSPFLKGEEPAPAGEAKPSQGLIRGYRLSFDGQNIDIDPQSVQERQRQRVANSLAPLLHNASTPEEQRAAEMAIQAAISSVGTLKPNEAIEYGIGLYKDPLDRSAKEKRARIVGGRPLEGEGYGGVPGLTEDEKKRSLDTGRYANSVIEKMLEKYGVKGMREELAQGEDAISKAKSPDALSQFASKATLQKMLLKGALSDADVARLEAAPGQWNRLEQLVNNWTEGGRLPPDVIRQIVGIAAKKNELLRERIGAAAKATKERVINDPGLAATVTEEELDDWGNQAYSAVTGATFKRKSHRAPKGGNTRRAAPKDVNAEADELLK